MYSVLGILDWDDCRKLQQHMGVNTSFSVRSAFVTCLILFACGQRAESILPGSGVKRRGEDVGKGECNWEMPNF